MPPRVGFVLLTHKKPEQIVRLIESLNRMFDYPPIACHHDFSKSYLSANILGQNVSLVLPHIQTSWATFPVVEAVLRALQLMYSTHISPDWFVLLSESDYPIKSAKGILYDLASSPYDVHMGYQQINFDARETAWDILCHKRYGTIRFRVPSLSRRLRPTKRTVEFGHPLLASPFLPFSKDFGCFAGEHWFCANRKAAEYLIEFHKTKPALANHYRRSDPFAIVVPEESYYHTIFCNAPGLKVSNNNWRYIDWSTKGSHPKTLLFEDLPRIQASSAHFARKFDIDRDARILDELDAIVG